MIGIVRVLARPMRRGQIEWAVVGGRRRLIERAVMVVRLVRGRPVMMVVNLWARQFTPWHSKPFALARALRAAGILY